MRKEKWDWLGALPACLVFPRFLAAKPAEFGVAEVSLLARGTLTRLQVKGQTDRTGTFLTNRREPKM